MRRIKLLLLKLLGNDIYQPEVLDVKIMNEWLVMSIGNNGFRHYYTMRKKYLVNKMALGIEGKEMWETLGRLNELKALSTNIRIAYKNLDKNSKKLAIEKK